MAEPEELFTKAQKSETIIFNHLTNRLNVFLGHCFILWLTYVVSPRSKSFFFPFLGTFIRLWGLLGHGLGLRTAWQLWFWHFHKFLYRSPKVHHHHHQIILLCGSAPMGRILCIWRGSEFETSVQYFRESSLDLGLGTTHTLVFGSVKELKESQCSFIRS